MQSTEKPFTLVIPALDEILLSIRPVVYGRYGVFADEALIAIYDSRPRNIVATRMNAGFQGFSPSAKLSLIR